ncbi:uncharacterized protein LOC8260357 [Ricinus communis]|uniref:Uncharacterized protein n=1 Tax=Ricinus communis TaxID=3988 RepID=B9SLV4_RICCO|nr:uncharacterized protein LOC8260357 [Ricinus communis]EEF35460.1 conserved hypothetical protein [Ricinus communis]|eukprot:XP_002526973.1 uncharacterized protein LOC8260357 [Ricinus communis]
MGSAAKFSYQRLNNEDILGDCEGTERQVARSSRSWQRYRRVHPRKRFRLKVPSLMRRFLRRKVNLVYAAYAKVLKRLKDGQAHFGDLFAGNYLFLQVNPTSLKYLEKAYHNTVLPSRYPLPRRCD